MLLKIHASSRAIAQAVNRHPLIAEARVRCEICGRRIVIGTGLSPSTSVSFVSIFPPFLHSHLHLPAALTRMSNGRNLGTLKYSTLSEIGKLWMQVYFYFFAYIEGMKMCNDTGVSYKVTVRSWIEFQPTIAGVKDRCFIGTLWNIRVFLPSATWSHNTNHATHLPLHIAVFWFMITCRWVRTCHRDMLPPSSELLPWKCKQYVSTKLCWPFTSLYGVTT
jgi:hypothetical protein